MDLGGILGCSARSPMSAVTVASRCLSWDVRERTSSLTASYLPDEGYARVRKESIAEQAQ